MKATIFLLLHSLLVLLLFVTQSTSETTGETPTDMVLVPAGVFFMGATAEEQQRGLIVSELVTNAIKQAWSDGQRIREIAIAFEREPNGAALLRVQDNGVTGPGIPPEELPSLFRKYRRAKKNQHREGLGLGLFIVKTLVVAHGGQVTVTSVPEHDTCFSVKLPVGPHT
jgi:signal transduction histidine kinase